MTAPTKAKAKIQSKPGPKPGPKPTAPNSPKVPANVPEVDKAPAAKPTRTGNSAYAAESVRNQISDALKRLWADGWTRPAVSAITGFTDSQVWRAANQKAHEVEVPVLMEFLKGVLNGDHTPPQRSRKATTADLEAKIANAIEALGSEAKTVAQLKKVVEAAREALTA